MPTLPRRSSRASRANGPGMTQFNLLPQDPNNVELTESEATEEVDPLNALEGCSKETCIKFLVFMMSKHTKPDKKIGGICPDWRQFKMLCARHTGYHMDLSSTKDFIR